MINSNETEKFEVGKEYWTFYMSLSKKRNRLQDYTGVMRVKLENKIPSRVTPSGYKIFTILESKTLGKTIACKIHNYLQGYGIATCNFFESKEECIKAHDERLIGLSRNLNTDDRRSFLSKLIKTALPTKSKIENDSIEWYEKLNETEQSYVKWLKHYYEEI